MAVYECMNMTHINMEAVLLEIPQMVEKSLIIEFIYRSGESLIAIIFRQ